MPMDCLMGIRMPMDCFVGIRMLILLFAKNAYLPNNTKSLARRKDRMIKYEEGESKKGFIFHYR